MEYYIPNKVMEPTWNLQSPARARRQFPKPFGNISISSRVTGSSSSCTPTAPFSYCPRYRFRPCAASLRARGVQLLRKWTRRSRPGLRKGMSLRAKMIGLDTNILVRYFTQDDPVQSYKATVLIEQRLTEQSPGFVSIVVLA